MVPDVTGTNLPLLLLFDSKNWFVLSPPFSVEKEREYKQSTKKKRRKAEKIRTVPSSFKYQIRHGDQMRVDPLHFPPCSFGSDTKSKPSFSLPSFLLPFPFLWQKPVIPTNIFYFRKHHAALKRGDVLSTSGWLFPAPPGRNKKKYRRLEVRY